jgi:hypothetical protein
MSHEQGCSKNEDVELWREREGDYYADSIHVTKGGGIGINCGGTVYVMPLKKWHELAMRTLPPKPPESDDSRSVQRRVALQKGEPIPTFPSRLEQLEAIVRDLSTLNMLVHPTFADLIRRSRELQP